MLNPNVGEMVSIASPLIRFKMVVFPALSSPLNNYIGNYTSLEKINVTYSIRIRISFSFCRFFFKIVNNPILIYTEETTFLNLKHDVPFERTLKINACFI